MDRCWGLKKSNVKKNLQKIRTFIHAYLLKIFNCDLSVKIRFFFVTFLVTFCWYHNYIIVLLLKCNYLNSTRVWHYMCIHKIILELIRILKYLSYGNHYTDMSSFSRCIIQTLCMLLYKISALHRHSNADIRRRIACLNWATSRFE